MHKKGETYILNLWKLKNLNQKIKSKHSSH